MLKKAIFVVLEVLLFLVVYLVCCLLPGANKLPEWASHLASGKLFIWDGLVFMALAFLLILGIQAAVKPWRSGWRSPVLAFVLALLLLAATRFPCSIITPTAGM